MNKDLILDKKTNKTCEEAVVISGSARSGTTIVGKIIHSFQSVEYFFEPPLLFSLLPLMDRLEVAEWKLLYQTYLYEELFVNALAGRHINCNRSDDSSIYHVKSQAEINRRLERSLSKEELEDSVKAHRLAFKIPDVVKYLPRLSVLYPDTRFVIVTREAPGVFASIFRKGWFDAESLEQANRIWPCYQVNKQKIPFWVEEADSDRWLAMDELHRVAYYYVTVNKPLGELEKYTQIKYRALIADPKTEVTKLADTLGLSMSDKTLEILKTISIKNSETDESILSPLNSDLREQVMHYSNLS